MQGCSMKDVTNSDGIVSKEEFVNFVYEYFNTAENKFGSAIMLGPLKWFGYTFLKAIS